MKAFLKSNEIKKILIRRNISQNYFAILVGTSSGYMSHLMTGKRNPSPKMRIKILKALNRKEFNNIFEIQNK
ncbi:unnamed protein product [marine sediment metagenome]|uniref:HTH cro/C1-type domain-containing protein n=1 Tax=marine sediment metagenome TaxID=412755 RepID=X1AE58_9ZZZZ